MDRERPNPREALALFAGVALLLVGVSSVLAAWGGIGVAASEWLALALPVVLYARLRGGAAALGWRRPSPRAVAGALLVGASLWFLLLWLVVPLQERLLPMPDPLRRSLEELARPRESVALTLFAAAITPAVCEELLCRGVLFGALVPRLGGAVTVGVTAALFAALHLYPSRLVPTFLLGLALGLLRMRSGSVVPPMIAHALNNAAVVAMVAWPGAEPWVSAHTIPLGIGAAVLFVVGHTIVFGERQVVG